jgi:hypothetical protein
MTTGKTIRVACARKLGFRLARGLSMKLRVEFWKVTEELARA